MRCTNTLGPDDRIDTDRGGECDRNEDLLHHWHLDGDEDDVTNQRYAFH